MGFFGWFKKGKAAQEQPVDRDGSELYDGDELHGRGGAESDYWGRGLDGGGPLSAEEDYEQKQRIADIAKRRALEEQIRIIDEKIDGGRYNPMQPIVTADDEALFAPEEEVVDDEHDEGDVDVEHEEEDSKSFFKEGYVDYGPVLSTLFGLVTGNVLADKSVSRFAPHAIVFFAIAFIKIAILFWSFSVDDELRLLQRDFQYLHEHSLRMQQRKIKATSYSAVEREVERRGLGLTRATKPAKNM